MLVPKNQKTDVSSYLDSVYLLSHSKNTVLAYKGGLSHFGEFAIKNYMNSVEQLAASIKAGHLDVYKIINEFVVYLDKSGKRPASIKIWLGAVKGYLRHVGIKIYSEDFKQAVRLPKKIRQREEPLTKETLVRLLRVLPIKLQTVVLVAAASGIRIGELVQLKISDVDFGQKPTKLRIRAEITKTRESRETFLTIEATKALKDYLVNFFGWQEESSNKSLQDKVIFGPTSLRGKWHETKHTSVNTSENSLITSLKWHIKKIPELDRLNENGRKMIHFHAFRKFFRTVVGDAVGRDFAEALMGHRFYLDTYYNLPEEKRREIYLKAEPYLTISDFAKIEKNLNKISERQNRLEEDYTTVMRILKNSLDVPKSVENQFKNKYQ